MEEQIKEKQRQIESHKKHRESTAETNDEIGDADIQALKEGVEEESQKPQEDTRREERREGKWEVRQKEVEKFSKEDEMEVVEE